jgi:hypothetical protein
MNQDRSVSADLANFYILIGGRWKLDRCVSGSLLNLCKINVSYVVDDDLSRRARQRLFRTEYSLSVPQDHGGMSRQWWEHALFGLVKEERGWKLRMTGRSGISVFRASNWNKREGRIIIYKFNFLLMALISFQRVEYTRDDMLLLRNKLF